MDEARAAAAFSPWILLLDDVSGVSVAEAGLTIVEGEDSVAASVAERFGGTKLYWTKCVGVTMKEEARGERVSMF